MRATGEGIAPTMALATSPCILCRSRRHAVALHPNTIATAAMTAAGTTTIAMATGMTVDMTVTVITGVVIMGATTARATDLFCKKWPPPSAWVC